MSGTICQLLYMLNCYLYMIESKQQPFMAGVAFYCWEKLRFWEICYFSQSHTTSQWKTEIANIGRLNYRGWLCITELPIHSFIHTKLHSSIRPRTHPRTHHFNRPSLNHICFSPTVSLRWSLNTRFQSVQSAVEKSTQTELSCLQLPGSIHFSESLTSTALKVFTQFYQATFLSNEILGKTPIYFTRPLPCMRPKWGVLLY